MPNVLNRRALIGAMGAVIGGMALRAAAAQEPTGTPESAPIQSITPGEMPTSGALRPGPIGNQSPAVASANPSAPAHITVPKAGIDAGIETLSIVDGVMENPTGPWVVAWYKETATLGQPGNVVLAGHVDYWNVGPSVFFNLRDLVGGDEITLTDEYGIVYTYAVETNEVYDLAMLTSGGLREMVAPTETQTLTIITCGGEFDYVNGEYLSRTIVRAGFVRQACGDVCATPEG